MAQWKKISSFDKKNAKIYFLNRKRRIRTHTRKRVDFTFV